MAKAFVNGINIQYQVKGEGPDVILIHGITSAMAIWYTKVIPALTPNYRVTAYDLRGHGYTDLTPSGYSSADMAQDLLGLMDHIGIERARLVGHSFGGSIGLHAALLQPDRVEGVVLVDTGIACLRHLRTIKEWPGWKLYEKELNDFGMTYEWFVSAESEDVNDVIRKSFDIPQQFGTRKGASRATPRLRKLVDETNLGREFRTVAGLTEERLAEVTAPVLAVYGEQSPYQRMAVHLKDVLPKYSCDLVADTGHFYLLQSPDLFVRRIEPFLANPLSYVKQQPESPAPANSTPAERTP